LWGNIIMEQMYILAENHARENSKYFDLNQKYTMMTEGLRCDVVVEACYELLGCNVWGKIVSGSTHYDISYSDTYKDEHNETHQFDIVEWEENLYPATQCGHESGERGTSWNSMFTLEPYLYEPNF